MDSFNLSWKGDFLRKVLEWLSSEDDANLVIESINGLIEVLHKYDIDVLKDDRVQSKIEELKKAFDLKDIALGDCKNENLKDENREVKDQEDEYDWGFFGLDDVDFNFELDIDLGEEELEDWIDFDFGWF